MAVCTATIASRALSREAACRKIGAEFVVPTYPCNDRWRPGVDAAAPSAAEDRPDGPDHRQEQDAEGHGATARGARTRVAGRARRGGAAVRGRGGGGGGGGGWGARARAGPPGGGGWWPVSRRPARRRIP